MRVDIVTKEYPPEIYGGAGVHVTELVKALRTSLDVRVRAFGAERDEDGTTSYGVPVELAAANAAVQTLGTDLEIVTRNVPEGRGTVEMLCVYEVVDGRIVRASFASGEQRLG